MAVDRANALKSAEKLLRQGKLDGAIAEYAKVVEAYPKDWTTANTLGDLYARAGQTDKAVAQYTRIADHFATEGFFPKASALYKKILKIRPDDEALQLQLTEVSIKQGLLADAKAQLSAIAERRRARGNKAGAAEIVVRLGSLDPADFDARRLAARTLAEIGDRPGAAQRYRDLVADLDEKGREPEALEMLQELVRCDPEERDGRARLARVALAHGKFEEAKTFLSREVAGSDPLLLEALIEIELRAGRVEEGLALVRELIDTSADVRAEVLQLALSLSRTEPDTAFGCVEALVAKAVGAGDHKSAALVLQEFSGRLPGHIPALLRLVEISVDGGLEQTMYETQVRLADAYLEAGQAMEASVIAEDLVAREPWDSAHIDRFRRALVMLRTPNPDAVIAERLSGQSPFTAVDPFVEVEEPAAPAEPPPPSAPEVDGAAPAQAAFQVTVPGMDIGAVLREAPPVTPAPASPMPPPADAPREPPQAQPPQTAASLEEVFKGLRERSSRAGGEVHGEHALELARTYREMGMVKEAMQELKSAVRSPRHRFEAASILAVMHKERGQLGPAVEWMERALEAAAPSPEAAHGLLYMLGETLESMGEVARALAVFLELQADAGDYRDVQARVDRLARVQSGG